MSLIMHLSKKANVYEKNNTINSLNLNIQF